MIRPTSHPGKQNNPSGMKPRVMPITKLSNSRRTYPLALLVCCLSIIGCTKSDKGRTQHSDDGLDLYRKTNDQAGHEFVKTEQFLVPADSVIVIQVLEFEPGISTLTRMQERIVQQIFNSIEEITENTVGDTNGARVAEFKTMEFDIRGYPDDSGSRESNVALSEARAKSVLDFLTNLGTPSWRLKAKGVDSQNSTPLSASAEDRKRNGTVVFVRTR